MEAVGTKGMLFGSPDEILKAHPNDHSWGSPDGFIGDAVVISDGTKCMSVFIGQGRAVLISGDGVYLRDDTALEAQSERSRVVNGAWLPMSLYVQAGGSQS